MRMDKYERRALKNALRDFDGTVHILAQDFMIQKKAEISGFVPASNGMCSHINNTCLYKN